MPLMSDATLAIHQYIEWRVSHTLNLAVTRTHEGLVATSEDGTTMVFGDDHADLMRNVRELLDDNRDLFSAIRFVQFSGYIVETVKL